MTFLARIRVAVKSRLARHLVVIEFCKDCGVKQPLVWHADDALWSEVWGNEGGVLCPSCFTLRCHRLGYFVTWVPTVERTPPAEQASAAAPMPLDAGGSNDAIGHGGGPLEAARR